MTPKKLDPHSIYAKYDINHDGTVSDEEMARNKELLELELQEEKCETQKQMAWVAMASMIIGTLVMFSPIITESRVSALSDLLGLFYIAQAGVAGVTDPKASHS